jgi:hypothetical protein
MKRKILLIVILIIIIGIGGKWYMDAKVKEENIEIEKLVGIAIKNTFKDIGSVKIVENKGKNNATGSYMLVISMENKEKKKVDFNVIYVKGEKRIENYGIRNREVQKEGTTNNKITLTYSDGRVEVI